MNKKILGYLSLFLIVLVGGTILMNSVSKQNNLSVNSLDATVISISDDYLTIRDDNNTIYTLEVSSTDLTVGDKILIEYTGLLDKTSKIQDVSIINYSISKVSQDDYDTPTTTSLEDGIFGDYYKLATNKLKTLSLEEKIGQIFLVRYPDMNAISDLEKYGFAGYVFYEKDFANKTKYEVVKMMEELQEASKIPILTAVDEEGGEVVRVSSNANLVDSKFKSPSELYTDGGFDLIKEDTINKSKILNSLGINLNLAPVVDVSSDSDSYIYNRTLKEDTALTATYAKTVITASKGNNVSYVLKHFPGYGNNGNTHIGSSTDTRSYDDIKDNDLPPFEAGIDAGSEAILVSHNIVTAIDDTNPASLSASVHNLLRNDLEFTGVIITDDLAMGAVSNIDNAVVKAILAGNDLIMITDYENSISQVKQALEDGTLSEKQIDNMVTRILAWKYYKGMMYENAK